MSDKESFDQILNKMLGRDASGSPSAGHEEIRPNKKNEGGETIYFSDIVLGVVRAAARVLSPIITSAKTSLLVFVAVASALFAFPPFVHDSQGYYRIYMGHHFILSPPQFNAYIDLIRIFSYLCIVAIVCAVWYVAAAKWRTLQKGVS
jgi:hypothetical protein